MRKSAHASVQSINSWLFVYVKMILVIGVIFDRYTLCSFKLPERKKKKLVRGNVFWLTSILLNIYLKSKCMPHGGP